VDEVGVLGVDSARLGVELGVQEVEEVAAVLFVLLDGLGVARSVVPVKLRGRPWRCLGGEEAERGDRKKTAAGRARVSWEAPQRCL
jgi:hypothetical protein